MSKWKQMAEDLISAGVRVDKLAVVFAGQDMIVGEVYGVDIVMGDSSRLTGADLVDRTVTLNNPKRILTLKMQTPQGLAINTFVGPLEMVAGGSIAVKPHCAFTMDDATDATKENLLGLYLQHIQEMRQNAAVQAGIHLPDGPLRPPNGLPNPNAGLRGALR